VQLCPYFARLGAHDLSSAVRYPQVRFEQRAAYVSVTYPRVMEDYLIADAIFDELIEDHKAKKTAS
jgi:hypothetical protein